MGTFVRAAIYEQVHMNLPWYKNLEPLLKLDEIYSLDHVTASRILKPNIKKTKNPAEKSHNSNITKWLDGLGHNRITPNPSKKFRTSTIINKCTDYFKQCWSNIKSNSSKLAFYDTCKTEFCRELYLSTSKGMACRSSMTRLRISAHDLEIEAGRYDGLERSQRTCKWCHLSMGENITESEEHLLFSCDLYSNHRQKLISRLNQKLSPIHSELELPFTSITFNNLRCYFASLMSPNSNLIDAYWDKPIYPPSNPIQSMQNQIVNCLCSYVRNCFDHRKEFLQNL